MSRIKKFIYLLLFCLNLSSCSKLLNLDLRTEKEYLSDTIQEFVTYTENKDKDKLKGLFSQNSISQVEDFDKQMDDLLEYYKGNKISYTLVYGAEGDSDGKGGQTKTLMASTDITTNEDVFRVAFFVRTLDTLDSKNLGFLFLYIIRFDDDPDSSVIINGREHCFTYWGDGLNTPGINIGKPFIDRQNEE